MLAEKESRQSALLRLLRQRGARSQKELVSLLHKAGFHGTQASISRDLRELGVVKIDGRYQPVAALRRQPPAGGAADPLHELIISQEPVGANLIVVRTRVGGASTVAVELDRRCADCVAGTVAGDDTILMAVKSRSAQGQALARLQQFRRAP